MGIGRRRRTASRENATVSPKNGNGSRKNTFVSRENGDVRWKMLMQLRKMEMYVGKTQLQDWETEL